MLVICDANGGGIYDYVVRLREELGGKFHFLIRGKNESYFHFLSRLFIRFWGKDLNIQSLMWPFALVLTIVGRLCGRKVFFEAHDDPFSEKMVYRPVFVRRLLLRLSSRVIVHSRYAAKRCEEVVKGKKIIYIPFGPLLKPKPVMEQDEARRKLGIKERNVILFFGIIQPNKGLDILIKAFAEVLGKEDVRLLIVGPSKEDFSKYMRMIDELRVSEKVSCYLKYYTLKESEIFFAASDFVVLPYTDITQSSCLLYTSPSPRD